MRSGGTSHCPKPPSWRLGVRVLKYEIAVHDALERERDIRAMCFIQTDVINRTELQRVARGFIDRNKYKRIRLAAIVCQTFARVWIARANWNKMQTAAVAFQAAFRGHALRLPSLFAKACVISYESAHEVWAMQRQLAAHEDEAAILNQHRQPRSKCTLPSSMSAAVHQNPA
jgi:hypothetical protein